MSIVVRSVEEGISIDRKLSCPDCKSDNIAIVLEDGVPRTICCICGAKGMLVDLDRFMATYLPAVRVLYLNAAARHREATRDLETTLQRIQDRPNNGNGHCSLCGHKRPVRICPRCRQKKLSPKQRICDDCKTKRQTRLCPKCDRNELAPKQRVCSSCRKTPIQQKIDRFCLRCGENPVRGHQKVCDSCKQQPKTHLCLHCHEVELTGKQRVCNACRNQPPAKPGPTKVRICPRCRVNELERYQHYCPDCKQGGKKNPR